MHRLLLVIVACGPGSGAQVEAPAYPLEPKSIELTEIQLPGLRLSVPSWLVKEKDETVASGVFRVEREAGAEQIQIGWLVVPEPTQTETRFLEVTLEGMKASGVDAKVVRSSSSTVSTHEARTHELVFEGSGFTAFLTKWHCPDDQRDIVVRSIRMTAADHRKVVDSLKCHTGTAGRPGPKFARFEPPAGLHFVVDESDRKVYSGNDGTIVLFPGVSGSLIDALTGDNDVGRKAREKLLTGWSVVGVAKPMVTHFTTGQLHYASAELTLEGFASIVVMTFVRCDKHKTVFLATFVGLDTTPRADIVGLLGHATCPE